MDIPKYCHVIAGCNDEKYSRAPWVSTSKWTFGSVSSFVEFLSRLGQARLELDGLARSQRALADWRYLETQNGKDTLSDDDVSATTMTTRVETWARTWHGSGEADVLAWHLRRPASTPDVRAVLFSCPTWLRTAAAKGWLEQRRGSLKQTDGAGASTDATPSAQGL